ncbi:MAG: acetyl-CoA hydrolase/transferase C-terminal domain-containing protein [Halanaeroarchaeum sp.]
MTAIDTRIAGELPVRAAADVAEEIGDDDTLAVSGFGSVGNPKAVPAALAESATDRDRSLTVISGGSTGEPIDAQMVEAGAIARRYPYQGRAESRAAINDREIAFHDLHIARIGEQVEVGALVDVDTAVVEAVAVEPGRFVPSTSIGHTPAYVAAADRVVVEVNESQPLALAALHDVFRPGRPPDRDPIPLSSPGDRLGSPWIEFDRDKLVGVVRTNDPDTPYSFREPTDADRQIASNFAAFVEAEMERNPALAETIRLQFGVGSLGNALMGAIRSLDVGDRTIDYFGEVVQDGLLDLLAEDVLHDASATSLALSEEGQRRLFENVERYEDAVVLRPASVSNRAELIDRFGVIAVNSAVEVDVFGNVNSTHVNGRRLLNGIGGSGDFNRNGLVSITALPSTAAGGDISRVVPAVSHVDHTEHDVSVIVTERGVADLRGLSPSERAEAIVESCAHPDYRGRLREYLEHASDGPGHVPHDPTVAYDWMD